MQFTRLRLSGFKSFVDPTDLVIAPGLTGVVGPNGCGKSNLLEAMRWVMGENRPTAMRGEGMEDVIFAGTARRPARNFAEVALVVDNGDRLAPAMFNEADAIEVVRRITRDAGSAYKVNGKDVRARDVQMLFADASTGAHSPALVRQGQIAELISARPKARRRVLEEAAGISGLYQRRHEAELKLSGAETNLARVEDVIEALRAQIATLTRQARQAARYRELSDDLRRTEGLLLLLRWREARDGVAASEDGLREATRAAARGEAAVSEAARARLGAEETVPPLREEGVIANAVVERQLAEAEALRAEEERLRAAIAGLEARITQLDGDEARERALNADAEQTIGALAAEAEGLHRAGEGHEARLAAAAEEMRVAAEALQELEVAQDRLGEDLARLNARHQSARRQVEDAQTMRARARGAAERVRGEGEAAAAAREAAEARLAEAQTGGEAALARAEEAETTLAAAETALTDAQAREARARAERSEAEGETSALKAEVAALARLVSRETAEQETLLDLLRVSPGLEAALGAALGDDLRAPVTEAGSGWSRLPGYDAEAELPAGVEPLAPHVFGAEVLARRLAQVGLVDAGQGAALQARLRPGQRLVSRQGDLWRWDGFRLDAEDAPSAAALRLQQINRLVELKRDLEEASARADGARRAHEQLGARLAAAGEAAREARAVRRAADEAVARANRAYSGAQADRDIAEGRRESLALALSRHEEEAEGAEERLREAEAMLAGLDDLDTAREKLAALRGETEATRARMLACRGAHEEVLRAGRAREARLREIERETATWTRRLEAADERLGELVRRREEAREELDRLRARPAEIAAAQAKLEETIAAARARAARAADALAAGETALRAADEALRDAERTASAAREERARAEARTEAAREAMAAAVRRIREDRDTDAAGLERGLAPLDEPVPGADALETEANRLRRQRDALGAVNLRAEEDARAVEEEHGTLTREKAELEEAIAKLRGGISALNREGRERLLAAFEQVNTLFGQLFRHLFGGGEARLVLVESDDPLDAGLEIMCQPPGKKLSVLSLLSGGEQTLTALALIFAVFLVNPAPICVLDEVDAPLDDANVTRFCDMLDEMTRRTETRFLIITHHAITMARMNRLFGVTMGEQGVSQLVSVDLGGAESLVA